MGNKLQSLDSIQSLAGGSKETSGDPVKKEYQEGVKFLEKEEYGQAAVALHNALVGFEEKQDEAGVANARNQLGHLCLSRNEYESALQHYEKTLEYCEKANDRMSILLVLSKIVAARKGLKQYDKAVGVCLDMLDLYKDNRDPQGTVNTLEMIADIYLADGQKEKAADTYRTIGSIHKNFRHDTTAAQYVEKAARLLPTVG